MDRPPRPLRLTSLPREAEPTSARDPWRCVRPLSGAKPGSAPGGRRPRARHHAARLPGDGQRGSRRHDAPPSSCRAPWERRMRPPGERGPQGSGGARRRRRTWRSSRSTRQRWGAPRMAPAWASRDGPASGPTARSPGAGAADCLTSAQVRQALVRRRGLGVQPARDPARRAGPRAGLDRRAHRDRHPLGILAARETELASSTPSQPSSIASAASEAVPIPASRITGTPAPLDDDLRGCTGCGSPSRSRSASRAASPPRSRPPRAAGRGSGRRWCRAGP